MFGKVFRCLWQGSLCGKADEQLVFVYMLAHADSGGQVEMVQSIISQQTGLPLDRVEAAIAALMAPDPESRTPDQEGRRLLPLGERSWGWEIVNYAKYRHMRDENARKEQTKRAVAKYRSNKKNGDVSHGKPRKAQGEVEVEGEEEKSTHLFNGSLNVRMGRNGHTPRKPPDPVLVEWAKTFDEWFWPDYWKKAGREAALKAWMAIPAKTQETVDAIGEGVARHRPFIVSRPKDKQPHASTYLNQRRWEDPEV